MNASIKPTEATHGALICLLSAAVVLFILSLLVASDVINYWDGISMWLCGVCWCLGVRRTKRAVKEKKRGSVNEETKL